MNEAEALTLCRLAKAMCPQQAIDEFTPEAWHLLLEPFRFEDAKVALVEHCRVRPFVAPSEIIDRVKKLRSGRLIEFGPYDVPAGLDEGEYRELIRTTNQRIADGDLTRDNYQPPAIGSRQMPELAGVFRRVDASLPPLPTDDARNSGPTLARPADRRTAEPEGNR